MAKVKTDDKEVEIKDGDSLVDVAEELGGIIACSDGSCGVCKIDILEGKENLNDVQECEKELGCKGNERLACQCKVKKGEVKIKPLV